MACIFDLPEMAVIQPKNGQPDFYLEKMFQQNDGFLTQKEEEPERKEGLWPAPLVENSEATDETLPPGSIVVGGSSPVNQPEKTGLCSSQELHADRISRDETNESKCTTAKNTIWIPEHLKQQQIQGFASARLVDLSDKFGAKTFGDWNEGRLLQLYEEKPKLLHDILVHLWFFGFQFKGKLGRFLKLQHEHGGKQIGRLQEDIMLNEILAPNVCLLLQRFGITVSAQLSSIPISSLAWLLRGRHEETVARLKNIEQKEKKTEVSSSSVSTEMVFRMNGQQIILPSHLCDTPIGELPFQGCNVLLNGIKKEWNISYLGELPGDLFLLRSRIKGVGPTAIAKFFTQLKKLVGMNGDYPGCKQTSMIYMSGSMAQVRETGRINWQEEEFVLTENEYHFSLDETIFTGMPRLILELHYSGIKTVGQLPYQFEKLLTYDGVGRTAVQKFYMQLCKLLIYRQQLEDEAAWRQMNHEERMTQAIGQAIQDWQAWLQGMMKSYIRERNQPVSIEELKEEFVTRRVWKSFTVDYNLTTDSDFVRVDFGVIGLRDFYMLQEVDLQQLYDQLRN